MPAARQRAATLQKVVDLLGFQSALFAGLPREDRRNVHFGLWTDRLGRHDQLFDLLAHFLFA